MKKLLCLILLLAVTAASAFALAETAEPQEETVIATVNGEPLLRSDYVSIENTYLMNFDNAGYDLGDEAIMAYIQDLALTSAIERMLVEQDMQANGCYDFDEALIKTMTEEGTAAYEAALHDVGEVMRENLSLAEDADTRPYALAYAEVIGVTEQDYIDVYRTQYATINYYDWLIRDNPITDEAVASAYDARIAASRDLYENDISAFETALSEGYDVWYKPEGYRSVLQILLPAQGETDEEKLASVKDTVAEIEARLDVGESFETLIGEYGTDAAFAEESFLATGYQVHRDSVVWEDAFIAAAFSEAMAAPGDHSAPFASNLGVHILYYLCDSQSGAIEMTEEIGDLLAASLYSERTQAALNARIDELADAAVVEIAE